MLMAPVTLHDLSQQGLILFSGEEAQVFLHNQVTCDVAALMLNRSTYGAYCTPKGRIMASFLLWRAEQGFFMQLPSSLLEPVRKRLSLFILRSKVKAADVSDEWIRLGVAGTDAGALLERAFGQAPKAPHEVVHVDGAAIIRLPVERFELIVPKARAPHLMESLSAGAGMAEPEHWDWLDIRAGVPVILPATQEQFVPQMANLDLIDGMSLTKGCYPGQEIVSRMHYRGTLKQRTYLANVTSEERPQPGDKLYSADTGAQSCGMIVNAARSLMSGYDVLAVIQIAAAGRGGVRWKSPDGPELKLLQLPYTVTEGA
jgi:tRNA-modifying protein YgfZ